MLSVSGADCAAAPGRPARTLPSSGRSKNRLPGLSLRSGELSRNPSAFSRSTMSATDALELRPIRLPMEA
ncbi:hypothetical protein D3C83_78420 [compost metagenome]